MLPLDLRWNLSNTAMFHFGYFMSSLVNSTATRKVSHRIFGMAPRKHHHQLRFRKPEKVDYRAFITIDDLQEQQIQLP